MLVCAAARAEKPIAVDGTGFLRNFQLENTLGELQIGDTIDGAFIEDSLFFVSAQMASRGFLDMTARVVVHKESGREVYRWERGTLLPPIDKIDTAQRFKIDVKKGQRYIFDELTINGLPPEMTMQQAERYFVTGGFLIRSRSQRLFSSGRLGGGVSTLQRALTEMGYIDAQVQVAEEERDEQAAEVDVTIEVEPGPRYYVTEVVERLANDATIAERPDYLQATRTMRKPWSSSLVADLRTELRNRIFATGRPDTVVSASREVIGESPGERSLRLVLSAKPGSFVRFEGYDFQGAPNVRDALLQRRVLLESGEPLDPLRVEQDRFRIARLGVFDRVKFEIPKTGEAREVDFQLEEGLLREASLRVGYGSYDKVRLGAQLRLNNLWGRAHRFELEAIQTFVSTAAEATYNIPALYGLPADFNARAFGIQRDEVSFERRDLVVEAGIDFNHPDWKDEYGIRYQLARLQARELESRTFATDIEALVGSVSLRWERDLRDSVLQPTDGYRLGGSVEFSRKFFGSEAPFERLDFGGSWHRKLNEGLWVNLAGRHGLLLSSEPSSELPFNKRFFPGGANSIRGYLDGEAAAIDPEGKVIGSETFLLLTAELEQALTPNTTAVIFVDGLTQSASADDWPGESNLFSVGAGLRYQTPLGPLRIEYGYNLDPRPSDGTGTLHISLGTPF
ncbi:MAG: BamA/OMP85 family outer membrane protein [Verrucomicrobiota bacterium]